MKDRVRRRLKRKRISKHYNKQLVTTYTISVDRQYLLLLMSRARILCKYIILYNVNFLIWIQNEHALHNTLNQMKHRYIHYYIFSYTIRNKLIVRKYFHNK